RGNDMTWTVNDVLDAYAGLIGRLRSPTANMASYMAFHMNRDLGKGEKWTQYYPVLPIRPARAVTDSQGAEFARFLGTGLLAAPVYQVTGDMCRAIDAMFEKTVAAETPVIYQASLPAAAGFIWLDNQLALALEDGTTGRVQAISWAAHNMLTDSGITP